MSFDKLRHKRSYVQTIVKDSVVRVNKRANFRYYS